MQRIQDITDKQGKALKEAFPQLANTKIGNAIAVYNEQKAEQYWLIPFLLKNKVRGIAMMDVNGKIVLHGVLMPQVNDDSRLIDKTFFEEVPKQALKEIKLHYSEYEIATPFISYDGTPNKWGWLVGIFRNDGKPYATVFVSTGGWYEKRWGFRE